MMKKFSYLIILIVINLNNAQKQTEQAILAYSKLFDKLAL